MFTRHRLLADLPLPSWHAIWAGTFLRARSFALHHCELLPTGTAAGCGTAPRSVLKVLEQARQKYQFVVVGYVVMPEHFHVLISEPERANPSVVIQALKLGVTRRILASRERRESKQPSLWQDSSSHRIWQARFYDYNVWSGRKRVEKLRYIHRNPVRRGLVESPDQWRWSSFRAYAYEENGVVGVNDWSVLKLKRRAPVD